MKEVNGAHGVDGVTLGSGQGEPHQASLPMARRRHYGASGETRARRASSFGPAAAAYAEHRPDYPAAAIRWALEPLAGHDGGRIAILDLAAGTGKLTAQLADPAVTGRAAAVIGFEPDPMMRAELRRRVPGVPVAAGLAEAIPLADGAADAVFAGQAAHWFDLDLAMPELARVLRPGGILAGLWNGHDDEIDWVAGLYRAVGHRSPVAHSAWIAGARDDFSEWLGPDGRGQFGRPVQAGFAHYQVRTADTLIETLRTHSNYLVGDPEMTDEKLAAIRRYLASRSETRHGEFRLPLYTHAVRITRQPQPVQPQPVRP